MRLDGSNFQLERHNLSDPGDAGRLTVMVCGAPLENVRFVDPRFTVLPLVPFGEVSGRIATAVTGTLGPASQPGVSDIVMVTPHVTEPAVLQNAFECVEPVVAEPELRLSPETATMQAGDSMQFSVTVLNAADDSVSWSASAGSVLDATANPVQFTAPATAGTVTLTASLAAWPEVTAQVTITVTAAPPPPPPPPPPPVVVTVTPETASLYGAEQHDFAATVTGAADTTVTWTVIPAVALAVNGNTVTFTAPADGTVQEYR